MPGDQPYRLASFSSDSIISGVRALPEKKFSDSYARSYLDYKDYVKAEYSHNFTQSNFQVKVFESGQQPFIHWSFEPQKMNFAPRPINTMPVSNSSSGWKIPRGIHL